MLRYKFAAILAVAILLCPRPGMAQVQDSVQDEIEQIKKQLADVDALKARLDELEKKLTESQKVQEELKKNQAANAPTVTTSFKDVKAKVDGRIFIGAFDSGDQGTYPNTSVDIPDAKLRFTFLPSKNITVVTRFIANQATTNGFDYMYIDYAGALWPTNIIRLGQRKVDVGQETWADNPIENMLINASVSKVSGYGTGLALDGRFSKAVTSPVYELGYVNGARGVMVRPTNSIPFNVKLGKALPWNLFASASYFDSGEIRPVDATAISVANLTTAPAGATAWHRRLWEVDLRYNYGPNGIRSVIPTSEIPKSMFGATYGKFDDEATGVAGRDGHYWFVEGLYSLTHKLYTAARFSTTGLDNGGLARLGGSPVDVNTYNRTSIGLGYKLSNLALLKTEYTINNTTGSATEPSLNQFAVGVAAKF